MRALGRVEPELEAPGEEACDARHHPFAGTATAHVDVAVIGIAHEAVAAAFQLPVQFIKHQVRQQRREHPSNNLGNFDLARDRAVAMPVGARHGRRR